MSSSLTARWLMRVVSIGAITCPAAALGCGQLLGLDDLVADLDGGAPSSTGGATTTSSSSGGGCSAACGTPGCGACPNVEIVDVPSSKGTLHVDRYETTFAEYQAWIATDPSPAQPASCAWNDSVRPGVPTQSAIDAAIDAGINVDPGGSCDHPDWMPKALGEGHGDRPVTCVDWCDAVAYCAWAGKHLCGRVGGGKTLDVTDETPDGPWNDPEQSEWYRACSNAGTQAFPYGDTYMPSVCNDENSSPKDVGSFTDCIGGYPNLNDMSGNVNEWEDACTDYAGGFVLQNCLVRGGAYYEVNDVEQSCARKRPVLPTVGGDATGFRCCSPAT